MPDQEEFFNQARKKSLQFAEVFEKAANEAGVHFLDAALSVKVSEVDGVHWDADQHQAFGKFLAELIEQILL
jgi:lysophospholipase L1-like esterase